MTELEQVRALAAAALAALEANRARIDDLNVYPVPDGDTGTNLTLTGRGIVAALETSTASDRATLAHDVTRAALMSARGNSGVILSQVVRGAAEVLGAAATIDGTAVAASLRGASDAAYRAVRRPVEGTMLTVVREMAAEAEQHVADPPVELLRHVLGHGEVALARTTDQLAILKEAGVVDAGGAGLVEIVRGLAGGPDRRAAAGGAAARGADARRDPPGALALPLLHRLRRRGRRARRRCARGRARAARRLAARRRRRTSRSRCTCTPTTRAQRSALGTRAGTIGGVEVANMHSQTIEREERLTAASTRPRKTTEAVVVVAGAGNRRLFESLGAGRVIEGGQTMNPSTEQIVEAIESAAAPEVVVLPNNSNVIMSAEQAARLASKPVRVVRTDSIPAGLAAMVVYDADRSAEANVAEMHEALEALATGAVTVASRDADLNGLSVSKGDYLGLVEGDAVAAGRDVRRGGAGRARAAAGRAARRAHASSPAPTRPTSAR